MLLVDLKIKYDSYYIFDEYKGNIRRTQPFNSLSEIKPDMTSAHNYSYKFHPGFSFIFANPNIDYEKELGWRHRNDRRTGDKYSTFFTDNYIYIERDGRKEKPFNLEKNCRIKYLDYEVPYIGVFDIDNPSNGMRNYFWVKDRWLLKKEAWKYLNSLFKMKKIGYKLYDNEGNLINKGIAWSCIEDKVL